MGSEEGQSVVVLNPWEYTQKQFMRKPCAVSGRIIWPIAKTSFAASLAPTALLSDVLASEGVDKKNSNSETTTHTMKHIVLALAVAAVAASMTSCSSKPAPANPPVVDMGARSSK